jgi:hypothetical protein
LAEAKALSYGWNKAYLQNVFSDLSQKENAYRIEIPLKKAAKIRGNRQVNTFLKDAGFKVDDYVAGIAIDQHGRQVKIGKILSKAKQPQLKKIFDEDPRRSSSNDNYKVIISRHPLDILSSSTGRGWTSCMALSKEEGIGTNRHYLINESYNGSLVAYLVPASDKNISRPSARLLIKRFTSLIDPNQFYYAVPERMYGTGSKQFYKTVTEFATKLNKLIGSSYGCFEFNTTHFYSDCMESTIAVPPKNPLKHTQLINQYEIASSPIFFWDKLETLEQKKIAVSGLAYYHYDDYIVDPSIINENGHSNKLFGTRNFTKNSLDKFNKRKYDIIKSLLKDEDKTLAKTFLDSVFSCCDHRLDVSIMSSIFKNIKFDNIHYDTMVEILFGTKKFIHCKTMQDIAHVMKWLFLPQCEEIQRANDGLNCVYGELINKICEVYTDSYIDQQCLKQVTVLANHLFFSCDSLCYNDGVDNFIALIIRNKTMEKYPHIRKFIFDQLTVIQKLVEEYSNVGDIKSQRALMKENPELSYRDSINELCSCENYKFFEKVYDTLLVDINDMTVYEIREKTDGIVSAIYDIGNTVMNVPYLVRYVKDHPSITEDIMTVYQSFEYTISTHGKDVEDEYCQDIVIEEMFDLPVKDTIQLLDSEYYNDGLYIISCFMTTMAHKLMNGTSMQEFLPYKKILQTIHENIHGWSDFQLPDVLYKAIMKKTYMPNLNNVQSKAFAKKMVKALNEIIQAEEALAV